MDAIVLAGGRARRLGGVDKATLEVGGRRLIDHVLDGLAGAETVVVVGPRRDVNRPVIWTREDPPGRGPAAALLAGLNCVGSRWVAVAGVDHPFLTAATYEQLETAAEGRDGAIAVDGDGIEQYLVGVYEVEALRAALRGRGSMKDAISALDLARVSDARASFDIDTSADLMEARRMFEEWVEEACVALEVEPDDVDIEELLDLAREVAHGVERRAAPIATFLLGLVVGRGGDYDEALAALRETAEE